ncbi:hypothetical protein IHE45_19G116400 [Dioscorea alata]|uniref:Uncharacterized protein n=1 Tax=Dioscorea alata TaxID=55571 RepID=A0ACB7U199_DIOAL|nr:hypothetical protein IHE45_19G116400 [Dioscorea alata]
MGNSLRCCLACILPCGALDVIRIVHLNGHVDEYSRQVWASEILDAHPNHVLSKPSSHGEHVVHRIMIVSPESELKRGHIYFLIPSSSVPEKKKSKKKNIKHKELTTTKVTDPKEFRQRKNKHSGGNGMWRPHLESIYEDL